MKSRETVLAIRKLSTVTFSTKEWRTPQLLRNPRTDNHIPSTPNSQHLVILALQSIPYITNASNSPTNPPHSGTASRHTNYHTAYASLCRGQAAIVLASARLQPGGHVASGGIGGRLLIPKTAVQFADAEVFIAEELG